MPYGVLKIMLNVIMLGTLLACNESNQPVADVSSTRLVRTLTVGGASHGAYQEFPGKVEAFQVAALSFRVSGELSALPAREGDAVAADQLVFTPQDAYDVCREKAADLIVLGLHETGGIARFRKIAHIAEAAGIDICLHGLYETGITTAAANQVGATLPNLDDGNQFMNHFLKWDIVKTPDLTLKNGRLPVLGGPGLGIELDPDAVAGAAEAHLKQENSDD